MSVRFPALAFPALVLVFASAGSGSEARAGAYIGAGFFEANREVPNPGTDYSARPGLSAGAVLSFKVAGRVNLWLEPGFVEKGVDFVRGPGGGLPVPNGQTVKSSLRFSYLELPILARGTFGSGSLRPYVLGGIAAGILLEARVPGAPDSLADLYRSWDIGLSLGAGIEMGRGGTRGFLEARYTLGLVNIEKAHSESGGPVHNRGAQLLAGVTFSTGG